MKKFIFGIGVVAVALLVLAPFALRAAEPNNQACLGEDFSGYAENGAAFGGVVSGIAQGSDNGFGNEIQAHQAGLIPDSIIPNSCND